jgi:hypothetical protein
MSQTYCDPNHIAAEASNMQWSTLILHSITFGEQKCNVNIMFCRDVITVVLTGMLSRYCSVQHVHWTLNKFFSFPVTVLFLSPFVVLVIYHFLLIPCCIQYLRLGNTSEFGCYFCLFLYRQRHTFHIPILKKLQDMFFSFLKVCL